MSGIGIRNVECGKQEKARRRVEGKQFDSGFSDILREPVTWAFSVDTYFRAHIIFSDVVEAV